MEYEFTSRIKEALESGVGGTADSMGREQRIRVFHKVMKVVLKRLQKYELKGFLEAMRELAKRKCVPILTSYFCHISEGENISAVQLGAAMRRTCARRVVTRMDNFSDLMAGELSKGN